MIPAEGVIGGRFIPELREIALEILSKELSRNTELRQVQDSKRRAKDVWVVQEGEGEEPTYTDGSRYDGRTAR